MVVLGVEALERSIECDFCINAVSHIPFTGSTNGLSGSIGEIHAVGETVHVSAVLKSSIRIVPGAGKSEISLNISSG